MEPKTLKEIKEIAKRVVLDRFDEEKTEKVSIIELQKTTRPNQDNSSYWFIRLKIKFEEAKNIQFWVELDCNGNLLKFTEHHDTEYCCQRLRWQNY